MLTNALQSRCWWWAVAGPFPLLLTLALVVPAPWAFGLVASVLLALATAYLMVREARTALTELEREREALRLAVWRAEAKAVCLDWEREQEAFKPTPHFGALITWVEAAARAEEEVEALETLVATLLNELKRRSVPSLSGFQLQSQ